MKKIFLIPGLLIWLASCESSVKADYDTIKAKKVILIADDGKEYQLKVVNDSLGKGTLVIEQNQK